MPMMHAGSMMGGCEGMQSIGGMGARGAGPMHGMPNMGMHPAMMGQMSPMQVCFLKILIFST